MKFVEYKKPYLVKQLWCETQKGKTTLWRHYGERWQPLTKLLERNVFNNADRLQAPDLRRHVCLDLIDQSMRGRQVDDALSEAIVDHKTDTGRLKLSSPELTGLDLLRYMHVTGTIDSIASVLSDLGAKMKAHELQKLAPAFERSVIQRLGYPLDYVKHSQAAEALHAYLQNEKLLPWVELDPSKRSSKTRKPPERDTRWNVLVHQATKADQLDQVSGGRGVKGGTSQLARELGLPRTALRRAMKIASLSPAARLTAQEAGLSNNQAALLDASEADTEQEQLERLCEATSDTSTAQARVDSDFLRLCRAWDAASTPARSKFVTEIIAIFNGGVQ